MPSSLVHSAKPDFRVIGTFRRRLCVVSASSDGRPEPDWRSFRAHLVRSTQGALREHPKPLSEPWCAPGRQQSHLLHADQVDNMGLESNLRLLSIQVTAASAADAAATSPATVALPTMRLGPKAMSCTKS